MTESSESVRIDSAVRQIQQKQVQDWSGKRVVLPRGATLPTSGLSGEVFIKIVAAGNDELYIWDENVDDWVKVGP